MPSVSPKDDEVNFSQLQDLQGDYPQLVVLISVGEANQSTNFAAVCPASATRANLARSCVEFMTQNGFVYVLCGAPCKPLERSQTRTT
jgi:GH18 family chitinase